MPSAPLAVAIAGLERAGQQHLERLLISSGFDVRAAFDPDPARRNRFADLVSLATDWRTLLQRDDVQAVFVTFPLAERGERVRDVLQSGKHVVVQVPMATSSAEVERLLELAGRRNRSICLTHPALWDADFQLARQVLRSGVVGAVEMATLCLWQRFPQEVSTGGTSAETALWQHGPVLLEQLLELVPGMPLTATCRMTEGVPGRPGFSLLVDFGKAVGSLQIHSAAIAPLDTGWTLTGTAGGYARHTQYTVAAEGEIVDEPLRFQKDPAADFYADLLRHLEGGPNPGSPDRHPTVLALLEASERSASAGTTARVRAKGDRRV